MENCWTARAAMEYVAGKTFRLSPLGAKPSIVPERPTSVGFTKRSVVNQSPHDTSCPIVWTPTGGVARSTTGIEVVKNSARSGFKDRRKATADTSRDAMNVKVPRILAPLNGGSFRKAAT